MRYRLEFLYLPRGYIDKTLSRLYSSLSPCNIQSLREWNEQFPEYESLSHHPKRYGDLEKRIYNKKIWEILYRTLSINKLITILRDFYSVLVPSNLWNRMSDDLTSKPYRISCLHSPVPYPHGEVRRSVFRFDAQTFNAIIIIIFVVSK